MSIARLKKLTLVGPLADKLPALEAVQAEGAMHLIPLSAPAPEPERVARREAAGAYEALRFLADMPDPRRQVRRAQDFEVHAFIDDVLALKQKLRETGDRRDFLKQRIADVAPWGDLNYPPRAALAGYRLWYYRVPFKHRKALATLDTPWQIVGSDARFVYVVLLAQQEPPRGILPVGRTHVGALPIRALEEQLEDAELELEALMAERQALTRFLGLLRDNISWAETRAELSFATRQTRDDDRLFVLRGWVPEDKVHALKAVAKARNLALFAEDPEPQEMPPTLLEQPQSRSAGLALAQFYQVPGYRDWDPTLLLVISFTVFFSMIIADAGYGFVLVMGLLFAWRRLGNSATGTAWRRMGLMLAGGTILYGVMVGSYFGLSPIVGTLPANLQVLELDDFQAMMRLSVIIGAVHVTLANLLSARARWPDRISLASIGWAAAVLGGLVLWLSDQAGPGGAMGWVLLATGLLAVLLFSGQRPIKRPRDHLFRLAEGVQAMFGAMGAFGDVLSYMRLFALGLASASLAMTFNELAMTAMQAMPGLGILIGLLILLVGHALNFALALMSGVVHGLRLNYIEFFKWGLPEEGTAFRAFSRKEVRE